MVSCTAVCKRSSSVMLTKDAFNPKRDGLFGQLNRWGGADSIHFGKRTVTPPNFILEQQTVSHMKAEVFC